MKPKKIEYPAGRGEGWPPALPQLEGVWEPRCEYLQSLAGDYGEVETLLPTVEEVIRALWGSVGQYPTDSKRQQYDRISYFLRGICDVNGRPNMRTPAGTKMTRIMLELFPEFEKEIKGFGKKPQSRRVILSCERYDVLRYADSKHAQSCLCLVKGKNQTQAQWEQAVNDAHCNLRNPDFAVMYLANTQDEMLARQVVRVGYVDTTFKKVVGLYLHSYPYGATKFNFKKYLVDAGVKIGGVPKFTVTDADTRYLKAYADGTCKIPYRHDPQYGHFE